MVAEPDLVAEIKGLVIELPDKVVYRLADTIGRSAPGDWQQLERSMLSNVTQPDVRRKVKRFIGVWRHSAPETSPAAVTLAFRAAMEVEAYRRRHQQLQLVWSGPDSSVIPLRRTDQALIQLIDEAEESLHIVSFAVYKIGAVAAALVRAAERTVSICIFLETADASEGKVAYDTVKALGQEVSQRATIYIWPLDQRQHTAAGKYGSLHAKIAVADGHLLLISSANLTEYAMKLNMEMGILVRGGRLPRQVRTHLERLVEHQVFSELFLYD